jgi:hypothetical protein
MVGTAVGLRTVVVFILRELLWENPDLGVLTPSPPIEGTEMPPHS